MKIVVTSTGRELTSEVDPRFGRAAYFLLVDPETLQFEAFENTQHLDHPQGAGIQAAQNVVRHGVGALLTGFCGPKAFRVLEAAGVQVLTGAKGRVIDAVQAYTNGHLTPCDQANVEGHWV